MPCILRRMNTTQTTPPQETIAVNFTGQLMLSRAVLQELLRPSPTPVAQPMPKAGAFEKVDERGRLSPLAYNIKETTEVLRMSPKTVYRLLQRGKLRSISATRHKLIPRKETERFLATATAAY
jgi:excisionase family DNA binding protein